jgi:hypothetical protein
LYQFLAALPPDALVAGWPADVINNVPYLSHHRALVTFETHQAFHEAFVQEMRRRMRALIDATFAQDAAPLRHLRDAFGVTHLLFDVRHLTQPPTPYFAPFDGWVALARVRGVAPAALLRELNDATVFTEGPYLVVDLRKLG